MGIDPIEKEVIEKTDLIPEEETSTRPKKRFNWKKFSTMTMMALFVVVLSSCAPTGTTPYAPTAGDGICEIYVPVLEWLQIIGGAVAGLAVIWLGINRIFAAVMPDIGPRTGQTVFALVGGLVLLGFGEGFAQLLQASIMGTYIDCDALKGSLGPLPAP